MSTTITPFTREETLKLAETLGWQTDADGPVVWAFKTLASTGQHSRVIVIFPADNPWEGTAKRVLLSHRGTDGQWLDDIELADPEVLWALDR